MFSQIKLILDTSVINISAMPALAEYLQQQKS